MERAPFATLGRTLRLTALWGLASVALAAAVLFVANWTWRADSWYRLSGPPDAAPASGGGTSGQFVPYDLDTLVIAGGGLAFNRMPIQMYVGIGPPVIEVKGVDGVTQPVTPGGLPVHTRGKAGLFGNLKPDPGQTVWGVSWFGVRGGGSKAVVVPLPVIALAGGAWPAVVAWTEWRRRRRGDKASGFAVIPSDQPRHDVP